MAEIEIKKSNLWLEAWRSVAANLKHAWPWIVGVGILMAGLNYISFNPLASDWAQRLKDNPDLFKVHPELKVQYEQETFHAALIGGPLSFAKVLISFACNYAFSCFYLRWIGFAAPAYSVRGYFYWLWKTVWATVRPMLWLLLAIFGITGCILSKFAHESNTVIALTGVLVAIVGFVFYMRAVYRYMLVGPLAIFRHGNELKTSRAITKGNVWRLVGESFLFFLSFILPIGCIVFFLGKIEMPGVSFAQMFGDRMFASTIGLFSGLMMVFAVAFTCIVYKYMSEEAREPS